jgi:hypothetical protein
MKCEWMCVCVWTGSNWLRIASMASISELAAQKPRNFFISWVTIYFSRKVLYHEVSFSYRVLIAWNEIEGDHGEWVSIWKEALVAF